MEKIKALAVGLFLILFGGVFLFFTYLGVQDDLWMKMHAQRIPGQVVEIKKFKTTSSGSAGRSGTTWKARVVFRDESGQNRSFWSDGYVFIPYRVGMAVIVLYDPAGEHCPRISEDLSNRKSADFLFLGIGCICLFGGLYVVWTRRLPSAFVGSRRA